MNNSMDINNKDLSGVLEHLVGVMKSGSSLATHYGAMEAAHDKLLACAKAHAAAHKAARASGSMTADLHKAHEAHMNAHESARLARLGYKAEHARHMQKVADAAKDVHKVLRGGGPAVATPISPLNRLTTADANKAAAARVFKNQIGPFDSLRKNSLSKPRQFVNSQNPLWVRG